MRSQSPDNHDTPSHFLLRRVGTMAFAFTILTGCASNPVQSKPDAAKVKQFVGQGYLTDDHYSIATSFASWVIDNNNYDITLTLPAKVGSFPLVIYLPGLGENRSAGEGWRIAWAQIGYAVLVVQPLGEDADAWSSALAHSGDFSALAHARYSANSMAKRLNALRQVMSELLRRQALKEVLLDRIDPSHTAIAGYDLGAYTAMVIAGETMRGFDRPTLPIPISAVIALSPYASFSGMAFTERYSAIRVPVLSVTSNNDSDSLGVVNSPSLRQAPFEYMPSGDKYLLMMSDIPHAMMSGNKTKPDDNEKKSSAEKDGHGVDGNSQGKGKGHHGTRHRNKGSSDSTGTGGGDMESGVSLSPTSQAMSGVAIQGIMVAFLDAFVKNDPIAREWLGKDAPRWLGKKGGIKIR